MINTEQPSTQWYYLAIRTYKKAFSVWDIEYISANRQSASFTYSRHLPLGFAKAYSLNRDISPLPENYHTSFLARSIKENSYVDASFSERPIDVLFVGTLSERRHRFMAENAEVFAKYNCYFYA